MPKEFPSLETNGRFLRLNRTVWVRADAIVVIRARQSGEGEGSEVIVRATAASNPNAYTVWTDLPADLIMATIAQVEGR